MFNFFCELAGEYGLENSVVNSFNLVNMSNKLIYLEGLTKIISIETNLITLKVKNNVINIFGENLTIKRISGSTITIVGNIKQIESSL